VREGGLNPSLSHLGLEGAERALRPVLAQVHGAWRVIRAGPQQGARALLRRLGPPIRATLQHGVLALRRRHRRRERRLRAGPLWSARVRRPRCGVGTTVWETWELEIQERMGEVWTFGRSGACAPCPACPCRT